MKRIYAIFMFFAIIVACSPIINAAEFQFDLDMGFSPRITAPCNPLSFRDTQYLVRTLYDTDIDFKPQPGFRFGMTWPLYKANANAFGLRLHMSKDASIGLNSLSTGIYISRSFGPVTPSIYVAATRYTHYGQLGNMCYSGSADSVLTYGLATKIAVLPFFNIQASYQYTAQAFVYNHQYKFNTQPVRLPDDYDEPVFSIHPSGSYYVGVSLTLGSRSNSKLKAQK